jgi:hypothetical protein
MKFYYADAQNKTAGPVTLEELQVLIKTGALNSNLMVVPEGQSEWKPLSAYVGQQPGMPLPPLGFRLPFSRTILGDLVAGLLKKICALLNESRIRQSLVVSCNSGHFSILSGGVIGLALCIVMAVRQNKLDAALIGIGFVIALAIGQFAAMKFLGASDSLIANTPHRISSRAFLDCTGLLSILAALAILVGGIIAAIQIGGLVGFGMAIPVLIVSTLLLHFGGLALNPQMVNITVGEGSAGEEAIGIFGFLLKAWFKLVPLSFLMTGAAANLFLLGSFGAYWENLFARGFTSSFGIMVLFEGTYGGLVLLLVACLTPIAAYLQFLLLNLGLEIIRSILSISNNRK